MVPDRTVLASFLGDVELIAALRRLRQEGHSIKRVFSPIPLPEVQELLGGRPSNVRLAVLLGAVAGAITLIGMATYAHLSYSLNTGGKPILPWIAWVIVCFEGTILGGVVAGTIAWIVMGGLPRPRLPGGYDGAFARDRFGVVVECREGRVDAVTKILQEEGAQGVRDVA